FAVSITRADDIDIPIMVKIFQPKITGERQRVVGDNIEREIPIASIRGDDKNGYHIEVADDRAAHQNVEVDVVVHVHNGTAVWIALSNHQRRQTVKVRRVWK